jgi:hypothetical protein
MPVQDFPIDRHSDRCDLTNSVRREAGIAPELHFAKHGELPERTLRGDLALGTVINESTSSEILLCGCPKFPR